MNDRGSARRPLKLLVAGGGTGGHLFPGIAVAEAFGASNTRNRVLFVNSGKPFEVETLKRLGFPFRRITIEGIKGLGRKRQLRAAVKIPKGLLESVRILREFHPDLVLGVGGYSSGPVLAAARLMGIKTALHEQNRVPGITNRILARFADRIFVSFESTLKTGSLSGPGLRQKARWTGNPVREAFRNGLDAENGPRVGKRGEKPFGVLIIGGSQGSHAINQAMTAAAEHMEKTDSIRIVHQTGPKDHAEVEAAYRRGGVPSEVRPFFHDMARRYRDADLLICRAGATTIAEVTAMGKAVIFIPFPFAADNHQYYNARLLTDAGAAELIPETELTGEKLAERIDYYAARPELLAEMASRSRRLGRPDAAERIMAECRTLLNGRLQKGVDAS